MSGAASRRKMCARFADLAGFEKALRRLKEEGRQGYDVYSPVYLQQLEHLMPEKRSPVFPMGYAGGVTGLVGFFLMCVVSALIYALIVGGKPAAVVTPYVVPAYEGTILLGALCVFFTGLLMARLAPGRQAPAYDERLGVDLFGIDVPCDEGECAHLAELFRECGAREVDE